MQLTRVTMDYRHNITVIQYMHWMSLSPLCTSFEFAKPANNYGLLVWHKIHVQMLRYCKLSHRISERRNILEAR